LGHFCKKSVLETPLLRTYHGFSSSVVGYPDQTVQGANPVFDHQRDERALKLGLERLFGRGRQPAAPAIRLPCFRWRYSDAVRKLARRRWVLSFLSQRVVELLHGAALAGIQLCPGLWLAISNSAVVERVVIGAPSSSSPSVVTSSLSCVTAFTSPSLIRHWLDGVAADLECHVVIAGLRI
jgi:hypothetical protein